MSEGGIMRARGTKAPKALFAGALGAVALTSTAAVLGAFASPSAARIGFQASGPAGMKIEGSTQSLNVTDDGTTLSIEVPLADLNTGIALRDQHMREKYLEVPKFPSAKLLVGRTALKVPPAGADATADVPAMLTLHGQTHPVTVHYDAKGDGAGCAVTGRLHVNMNDYGITVPSYLGVTVKPDVDVTASFHVAGN
jgi:polyisoprenoid-binding protein YceI